jgi:hypothetical protein
MARVSSHHQPFLALSTLLVVGRKAKSRGMFVIRQLGMWRLNHISATTYMKLGGSGYGRFVMLSNKNM